MFENIMMQYAANMFVKTQDNDIQDIILIDNMSKLTKALTQHQNKNTEQTRKDLTKAITDVLISAEIVRQIFDISEEDIQQECLTQITSNGWHIRFILKRWQNSRRNYRCNRIRYHRQYHQNNNV